MFFVQNIGQGLTNKPCNGFKQEKTEEKVVFLVELSPIKQKSAHKLEENSYSVKTVSGKIDRTHSAPRASSIAASSHSGNSKLATLSYAVSS